MQNKTPVLGLRFQNHFLFGLDNKSLKTLVEKEIILRNDKPLRFIYKNKTFEIKPSEIGYKLNSAYITNQLLQTGRTGNLWQKFLVQESALLGLINVDLKGTVSQSLLTIKILAIQSEVNTEPRVISLDFAHDMNKVLPASDGEKVHVDKLTMLIAKYIGNPTAQPLNLPTYVAFPNQHSAAELDSIRKQAVTLINGNSITIMSGGLTFTLTPQDLKNMLIVVERPDPANPKKTRLMLRLDTTLLNQRLGSFASQVENVTNAEFNDHDARTAIYAQFYNPQLRRIMTIPTGMRLLAPHVLAASDQPSKIAYLTFDDGPNTLYHPMILDILQNYHVPATFFLVGQNIPQAHDTAVATITEGNLVGNHSFSHSFLPRLTSNAILNELIRTDNILQSLTMKPTVYFRPPYGGVNTIVINDAHSLGLRIFLWDVDPRDWSEPTTDELVRRVVSAAHNGADILLHSNHLATVKALPRIIETLQAEGYVFHTLSDYPNPEEL